MADLLPCPWCGESLRETRVSEGSTFRWRKVEGCCADGPEIRHDTMADDQPAAEIDSTRRAIEAWNTRANRPAVEAKGEAVADDIDPRIIAAFNAVGKWAGRNLSAALEAALQVKA